jgi:hypothetical protein
MLASTMQFSRYGRNHASGPPIREARPQAVRVSALEKRLPPQDPTVCPESVPPQAPVPQPPEGGSVLAGSLQKGNRIASAPLESMDAGTDDRCPTAPVLLRKEVIQPHLPVRLPCYDFVPIADPTFDSSLPYGLGRRLRVLPTFVT